MKRFFVLLVMTICACVCTYSVQIEGLYYTLNAVDQTASVVASPKKDYVGEIVIPESVIYKEKEYSVTSIGKNAFRSNAGVTKVVIPASVDSIASSAFYSATGLEEVVMHNSVRVICDNAFGYCSKLQKINMSSALQSVGNSAFLGCSALTNVEFSNSVKELGTSVFYGCSALKSVVLPSSITSIPKNTFYKCLALEMAEIPASVEVIGEGAFSACKVLNGLNLPSSLRKIGARAFSGCKAITHVEFPDNVDTIQANTFQACSSLTSVDFNNVVCISDYAFSPCPIKNLDFNSGLDSIGRGAFQGNLAVEALVLPESLKTTGALAFADCKNLKTADLKNLTYLNNKILTACFNLEDITLSSNVEYMANDAFDRDSLLRYVYVHYKGQTPSAFADCYFADENLTHNVTIYVQDDLVDQFKTELTNFNGSIRGFEESTPVFVKYVKSINAKKLVPVSVKIISNIACEWSIDGVLPDGLTGTVSEDGFVYTISGTPTAVFDETEYRVTAKSHGFSVSDDLTIRVDAVSPYIEIPDNVNQSLTTDDLEIEDIVFTTNDPDAVFEVDDLPEGLSAVQDGATFTISGSVSSDEEVYEFVVRAIADGMESEAYCVIEVAQEEEEDPSDDLNIAWTQDKNSVSVSNVEVESMALYTASGALVRNSNTNKISTASIKKGDVFMVSVRIAGLDRWVTKKFIK